MSITNLAKQYAKEVDERFSRVSQADLALNHNYKFSGVQTVCVYSLPVVPMQDYRREGANRYGTPADLGNSVQEMTVSRDRAFTFVIDKGDNTQSQLTADAGRALSRQLREVCVPEYDAHVFSVMAKNAGESNDTAATKDNAYELLLKAQEHLGNANVPDVGRVCFASYRFANFLMQDPAFMKQAERSQEMVEKGILGEVDGVKLVKVPASRLPAGCEFILAHPLATVAPKQLESYKLHTDPPGISGWLCEGRLLYDAFVLENKKDAIYYQGPAVSE